MKKVHSLGKKTAGFVISFGIIEYLVSLALTFLIINVISISPQSDIMALILAIVIILIHTSLTVFFCCKDSFGRKSTIDGSDIKGFIRNVIIFFIINTGFYFIIYYSDFAGVSIFSDNKIQSESLTLSLILAGSKLVILVCFIPYIKKKVLNSLNPTVNESDTIQQVISQATTPQPTVQPVAPQPQPVPQPEASKPTEPMFQSMPQSNGISAQENTNDTNNNV